MPFLFKDREIQQAQLCAEPVSFELPWGTLRGLRWGNSDAVPILAVHGWLDNCHSFLPIAAEFLQNHSEDQALLALDWAGHGHSDHRPVGAHYHFIDYVYDLHTLIRQEGWQQVPILAHSMGAFAANILAGIAPDKVQSLYLIEAFGLLHSKPEQTAEDLRKGFTSRDAFKPERHSVYPSFARAVAARTAAGDFESVLAELLVKRGIKQLSDSAWQFRADGRVRIASPYRFLASQIAEVLTAIEAPLRLVRGSDGFKDIDQSLVQWGACVPQLSTATFSGGHHVHMQQPQRIWQDYFEFTVQCKAASRESLEC